MKFFQKHAWKKPKSNHDYDLTYDNVAIPEIHTHKVSDSNASNTTKESPDACYDNVAIPEIHISHKNKS